MSAIPSSGDHEMNLVIGEIVAFICSARAAVINGSCIRGESGLARTVF